MHLVRLCSLVFLSGVVMTSLSARALDVSPQSVEANPDIPVFEESAGALVLRFNPDSEVAAQPAIRDAVASIILAGIKDGTSFPRAVGFSAKLRLSAPGFTGPIMEYDKALIDFGGAEPSIEALAMSSGLVPGQEMLVLKSLNRSMLASLETPRPVMRQSLGRLTEAGYVIDEGRLLSNSGTPVEIRIAIAGQYLSGQQRDALKSAANLLSRLGIMVRLQNSGHPDTRAVLAQNDAMIALENATPHEMLLVWLSSLDWSGMPVGAFMEGLPNELSHHQEITFMAILDAYLSAQGYAFALAEMKSTLDLSEQPVRAAFWLNTEAMAYVAAVCEGDAGISVAGWNEAQLAFRSKGHPLVMYLPRRGGPGKSLGLALIATEEQVGIPDKGILRIERLETAGGEPAWMSNRLPLTISVERMGRALFFKDPVTYLELARQVELRASQGQTTTARMVFQQDSENGLRGKLPEQDDMVSAKALTEHEFAGWPGCAARIHESDEKLTLSSLTSVE